MYQFSTTLSNHFFSHVDSISANENVDVVEELSYDAWGNRRFHANWAQPDNRTSFITNRGFTGHEHLDMFQLINMNGRMYDSDLGMMLSPDNYVQAPDYSQNYNRYSYCFNNPLVYTDPSGEIAFPLFIGMAVGMHMGSKIAEEKGATGYAFAGYVIAGAAIGGLSAYAGIMAGGAVAGATGTIGFAGGAMTGGAAGFSGGFISGAGNAWLGGASFGDGLGAGIQTGLVGGFSGGVIGGISGGITAYRHNGQFWSGKGATFDALATSVSGDIINIGEGMDYSNDYARQFSDDYFGKNIGGLNELRADGSIPSGYSTRGDVVLNRAGQQVKGSTVYLGTGKGSNVFLYKAAFTSNEQLYFTMGHEYLHVAFNYAGVGHTKALNRAKHASIYKWEAYQAKAWGFNETAYASRYMVNQQYYNAVYDFSEYGFFILSIKPW